MDVKVLAGGIALMAVGAAGYWWLTQQRPSPVTGVLPVTGPTPAPPALAPVPVTTPLPPDGGDIIRPMVIAYCRDGTMVPSPSPSYCVGRGGLYGIQPPAGVEIRPWPYWGTRQPIAEIPHPWWRGIRLPVQPPGGIYS